MKGLKVLLSKIPPQVWEGRRWHTEERPGYPASTPEEGQEQKDNPGRRGQEEEARGTGTGGHRKSSTDAPWEDSRKNEKIQFLCRIDKKSGRTEQLTASHCAKLGPYSTGTV